MRDADRQKIIRQCLRNKRRAQEQLYQSCFPLLMSICLRYQKNRSDAVALLNEGFLKILTQLERYQMERSFEAWICTIMVRTAIDQYRKERHYREQTELTDDLPSLERYLEEGTAHDTVDGMDKEALMTCLAALPEQERLTLDLFEWQGFSHREIAKELGISERSSKRYLQQAKNRIKAQLKALEGARKAI
jgi:RNA polymerase sigma factor, sigma-70 family